MAFWLLMFLVLIALVAALPTWPYSRGWGYFPAGGAVALFLLLLLIFWWFAWLPI